MTSSHTPASEFLYAVRIMDGDTIVADRTEPTPVLEKARTQLAKLQYAFPASVLVISEPGSYSPGWQVATDDLLRRMAYARAADTITKLVGRADLPLIDWGINEHYDGSVRLYANTSHANITALADAIGMDVVEKDGRLDGKGTFDGIDLWVYAYRPAAESKAAA
ncbi:hypothetical protein [Acrocarpospora catenulata]|uniref:hypothetical protein n=1 Tax=Acrocarpospora catenulata TaxID=2836182 RepID=UPI001BDA00BC|nr:hypothetical protein [Acrocarpospora catenulata]